jgi:hypothetical protein
MSYCPFCGKLARWPAVLSIEGARACSMRCAAHTALAYIDASDVWDAAPYCTRCGDEGIPGHCEGAEEEVT